MNPHTVVFSGNSLTLVFNTMQDAIDYINTESHNKEWCMQWRFEYNCWGGANAITEKPVNITLREPQSP